MAERKLNRAQTSDIADWLRRVMKLLVQHIGNRADAQHWLESHILAVMTEYALGTQPGNVYRNIFDGV